MKRIEENVKKCWRKLKKKKEYVKTMTENMIIKEKELNELITNAKIIEMKNEINGKIETIEKNYLQKNEFENISSTYLQKNHFENEINTF